MYEAGVLYLDNVAMKVNIVNTEIENSTALYYGGVFYISNVNTFYLNQSTVTLAKAMRSSIMEAISQETKLISLNKNKFKCLMGYNHTKVMLYIINDMSDYEQAFYISKVASIKSMDNDYSYCLYGLEGGVFKLEYTNFYDSQSSFYSKKTHL